MHDAADPGRPARVSAGIPLGCRDRRVPDRGIDGCRRPRSLDLGRVLAHARSHPRGRERRRGIRQLPPLPRRRRTARGARRHRLPLLDLVAARATRRQGAGERAGARLLRTRRRRVAHRRHRAVADALPLGPAAAARRGRRMARPRHRDPIRRLRRGRARSPRRPRAAMDHPERAGDDDARGLRARHPGARARAHAGRPADRTPPVARARARRCGHPGGGRRRGRHHEQPHPGRAGDG